VRSIAGLVFLIVHAIYVRYFAKQKEFASNPRSTGAVEFPERIPRHSLTARLFHWISIGSWLCWNRGRERVHPHSWSRPELMRTVRLEQRRTTIWVAVGTEVENERDEEVEFMAGGGTALPK
jgi:hypothetical protein